MDQNQNKLIELLKEHYMVIGIGLVGVVFLVFGLFGMVGKEQSEPVAFRSGKESASTSLDDQQKEKQESKKIVVDVSGAVLKPGVYSLPTDSRVKDALLAAGGMSAEVDQQKVAQSLNLAAPLTDGAKLYIPSVTDQMAGSGGTSANSSAKININSATESELDTLSGIGKVTAGKIIANRPYKTIQELVEKKAVGASVFEKIKDQISVF